MAMLVGAGWRALVGIGLAAHGLAAGSACAQAAPTPAPSPSTPVVVTPWPVSDPYAHVLRYYPGLTFKQGQAPIRDENSTPGLPEETGMALGFGLEGRTGPSQGWQVLANLSPTPFAPVFDPHLSLHGYLLPRPTWGLDADISTDVRGGISTELGSSWLARGPASLLCHQARLAVGRRVVGNLGYGYGQLTAFRDDAPWLAYSGVTLFGTPGGWRASWDLTRLQDLSAQLRLRLDGSLGTSGGLLPAGDRLSAGLASQDWQTTATRTIGRAGLVSPLIRGVAWPLGPLATLRQVEGCVYVESGMLWGADLPARDGLLAGTGVEAVLVTDTLLGFPFALSLGYAVPLWHPGGPTLPWPGRAYFGTTVATFALEPAHPAPASAP